MNFRKGDIVDGERTVHKIVYIERRDEYNFAGCMLTHTKPRIGRNNIELSEVHFERVDENGNAYEFQFDRTYFVKTKLLKKAEWGPYRKIGRMSNEGIEYLENELREIEPINWQHYNGRAEDNNI